MCYFSHEVCCMCAVRLARSAGSGYVEEQKSRNWEAEKRGDRGPETGEAKDARDGGPMAYVCYGLYRPSYMSKAT